METTNKEKPESPVERKGQNKSNSLHGLEKNSHEKTDLKPSWVMIKYKIYTYLSPTRGTKLPNILNFIV